MPTARTEFDPSALRDFRQARDLTHEGLALLLNVNRTAVTQWESGDKVPSRENLFALADVFGVRVDRLVRRTNGKSSGRPTRRSVATEHAA